MLFLGRVFQLLGLVVAGYGLFVGLYEQSIRLELLLGAFGGALFLLGWLIQKRWGRQ